MTIRQEAVNNVLNRRFGTSQRLMLTNGEWLRSGMGAKTVKFTIGSGGLPPEVNWEDRSAAVAMIDDEPAKALASILMWGEDSNWDWSRQHDEVVNHLATNMIRRCQEDGRMAPQACRHTLPDLAQLMARMVLNFELYELWDIYTVKGRLQFSGIAVNASTYTNVWLNYQRKMIHDLSNMVCKIDYCVSSYRRHLNDVC